MILVTGGAGFIGSNLCRRLLSEGNKIICLDNLSSGNIYNIKDMIDNPNFKFVKQSTEDLSNIEKVDYIFNLASPASPIVYNDIPLETVIANTYGVKNGLDLARKYSSRYLHASTSEVYGNPKIHPQKEDYNGDVPIQSWRACYDESKRMAEVICGIYSDRYGVDIRLPRIFNTYGPGMHPRDGRVVSNFIVAALSGRPLIVNGDGSITRSFCFVDDSVDALIKLMFNTDYTDPVNMGNTNETTILELAETIIKITNSPSTIKFVKEVHHDPCKRKPDISLIQHLIDWEPSTLLEDGIAKTANYFIRYILER